MKKIQWDMVIFCFVAACLIAAIACMVLREFYINDAKSRFIQNHCKISHTEWSDVYRSEITIYVCDNGQVVIEE